MREKRRVLTPQTNSLPVSSGMQTKGLVVSAHPSVLGQQSFCVAPKEKYSYQLRVRLRVRYRPVEGQVQTQVGAMI